MPDAACAIALLAYRGNPHSGGQGVYIHYLSRELVALGHHVEVFSGPPYPRLAPGVPLVEVPSLDLYRPEDPFRTPALAEFRDLIDVAEFAIMCAAGFPEPLTFSLRARRALRSRRATSTSSTTTSAWATACSASPGPACRWWRPSTTRSPSTGPGAGPRPPRAGAGSCSVRRWYGFVRMQKRVAAPHRPGSSRCRSPRPATSSAQMGVRRDRLAVVPVGVDTGLFRPLPDVARVPGRLMTTASADVPLKGLVPLLEALAKVRTERHAELVVVGQPRDGSLVPATIERLGLEGAVTVAGRGRQPRMVELYAEAEVAVVPSLYEGFSLPAVEAMACGLPLVTTTGGALPEVVGRRRRERPARAAQRPRRPGRRHRAGPRRRRAAGPPGRRRPGPGARPLHVAGHGRGHRRRVPAS